jgi:hypothetical protein
MIEGVLDVAEHGLKVGVARPAALPQTLLCGDDGGSVGIEG